jgi:hypothetical protein
VILRIKIKYNLRAIALIRPIVVGHLSVVELFQGSPLSPLNGKISFRSNPDRPSGAKNANDGLAGIALERLN